MSKTRVVIDTNVLVAWLDEKDVLHEASVKLNRALQNQDLQPVFLDIALTEALSVMARRFEERKRPEQFAALAQRLNLLIPSGDITWLSPHTQVFFEGCLEMMIQYQGRLNFNDAFIALFCRKAKINKVASFDSDFDHIKWVSRVF